MLAASANDGPAGCGRSRAHGHARARHRPRTPATFAPVMHYGVVALENLSRAYLLERIAEAEAAGHFVELAPARVSRSGSGVVAQCSCGWHSHPQSKPARALLHSMRHLGEVIGDERFVKWSTQRAKASSVGVSPLSDALPAI